jgi:hypothetical protein
MEQYIITTTSRSQCVACEQKATTEQVHAQPRRTHRAQQRRTVHALHTNVHCRRSKSTSVGRCRHKGDLEQI